MSSTDPPSSKKLKLPPPGVAGLFSDSAYDPAVEAAIMASAQEPHPHGFIRGSPFERGKWPSYVYVAIQNSEDLQSMASAAIEHLKARLKAYTVTPGPVPQELSKDVLRRKHKQDIPDLQPACKVIPHDATDGTHHLSLSRTLSLRDHQLAPFTAALRTALQGTKPFCVEVSTRYDVLVNEVRTRSFLSLRVTAGTTPLVQIIKRVNAVLIDFKQSVYHAEPILHVSVASMVGDITGLLTETKNTNNFTDVPGVYARSESSCAVDSDSDEETLGVRVDAVTVQIGMKQVQIPLG